MKQMHRPTKQKRIDRHREQTSGRGRGEEMGSCKHRSRRLEGMRSCLENECRRECSQ